MSKVLAVVAHPDDEILGVGGTLIKHSQNNDEVYCLILGEGMTSRTENRGKTDDNKLEELHNASLEAAEIIGIEELYFSNFPDNRFDSIDLLDIIKEVEKYIEKINPEIIYTHYHGDLNIDHKRTFQAVITACRPIGNYNVKAIYAFETPSSTEWSFGNNNEKFSPNVFVDIERNLPQKLKAMECYQSEIRDYPHPRSTKALETIAARWGIVVGKKYVEPFKLIRKVK